MINQQDWGASIVGKIPDIGKNSTVTVDVLRLSKFVLDVVAKRDLPKALKFLRPPTVLMKLDIEGVSLFIGIFDNDYQGL